jgi:hypothetical protein
VKISERDSYHLHKILVWYLLRESRKVSPWDLAMRYFEILRQDLWWICTEIVSESLPRSFETSNLYMRFCFLSANNKIFFYKCRKLIITQSFWRSRFEFYSIKILLRITRISRVEIYERSLYEILRISCYDVTRRSHVKIFRLVKILKKSRKDLEKI